MMPYRRHFGSSGFWAHRDSCLYGCRAQPGVWRSSMGSHVECGSDNTTVFHVASSGLTWATSAQTQASSLVTTDSQTEVSQLAFSKLLCISQLPQSCSSWLGSHDNRGNSYTQVTPDVLK